MTAVHIAIGVAMVFVNLAAGLIGAWHWWRATPGPRFWRAAADRAGVHGAAAADGLSSCSPGEELPELHLVYGLTPLAVSFLAEQLRLASADTVLQARDLEDAQAMRGLPEAEQQRDRARDRAARDGRDGGLRARRRRARAARRGVAVTPCRTAAGRAIPH